MTLRNVPPQTFKVTVKEYRPRTLLPVCPAPTPAWVKELKKNGTRMALEPILIQAGRHFADSLNMTVFAGSATRRQESTRLAWTLVSMVQPMVVLDRLEVADPGDQDIKRLASEVLGVGGALELLRQQKIIDARTIRKLSSRFDFDASSTNATGKVLIEAKGTTELGAVAKQRASFKGKLNAAGFLAPGAVRGYERAVGVIFSTWTSGTSRKHDIELLDPEFDPRPDRESAIRELIRFYARRFDETAGLPEAASRLWRLAEYDRLFDEAASLREYLGEGRRPGFFSRSAFVFRRGSGPQTFWGSFWEGDTVPCPLMLNKQERSRALKYAYTGIDHRVVVFLRERRFDDLLKERFSPGYFTLLEDGEVVARFLADDDGIVRGWMSAIPDRIEHDVVEE